MEIDGTVREISGDNDMVNIKMREMRNVHTGNHIHRQLENISGENGEGKEVTLLDSKRKRVEESLQGEIIGENNKQDMEYQDVLVSKNGQEVGSGFQAHRTL